ncbi:MAG: metalloregulator ArsR/SmtB family transcription factor [Mariprofundaceae bacterium]
MHSALVFKALSDPLRLRMIYLLTRREELCVCHFTDVLGLPQSSISRHLSQLRHLGLVETRREGKWVHYRLSQAETLMAQLQLLIAGLGDEEIQLRKDAEKLTSSACD